MPNPFSGQPNFDAELNAQYVQVWQNGSTTSTDCYIDITKNPIQATSITKLDDSAIAGPQTDAYILYKGQQYRDFLVIGETLTVKED